MSVDHTAVFKAHARTLASQAENPAEDETSKRGLGVTSMYKKLITDAFSIGRDLTELQQVVLSRRRGYLSFNSPMRVMGESERDAFDKDTQKALSQLEAAIRRLKGYVDGNTLLTDEKKLLLLVVDSLQSYLKRTAKIVTDMRTIRVHNTANQQRMQRLYCLVEAKQRRSQGRDGFVGDNNIRRSSAEATNLRYRRNKPEKEEKHGPNEESEVKSGTDAQSGWDLGSAAPEDALPDESELSNLSPQDRTQLMVENERMFDRFSHVHAQIEGLETQIAEIQRLQEAFSEKVMDQEKDIEIINEQALHTSENLKDGNEWIRQAISNSAGRRVVVLFCIIVITFTLLFLDWYNP
ncbi:unnamed protein product [Cylicocyclus nassatus]|uniref:t-SNARE coiled-coil homology domain-containing protein n=1 Tax=Cylicocyclus nassatus TaxID=53992 RepID=A0AA36DKY6_CYLNA|nr:unnamed protein product [Cylicocyclus nassatus]